MNRRTTFTIALVTYLCVFLTGGPFVMTALAKITMKATDDDVKIVTIAKGDTLWDLATKYLQEAEKWPWFKEYNEYTDPHMIFPGERMQIPLKWLEGMLGAETQRGVDTSAELEELRKLYEGTVTQLKAAQGDAAEMRGMLDSLKTQNAALERALKQRDNQAGAMQDLLESASSDLAGELAALGDALDGVAKSRDVRRQLKGLNEELSGKIADLEAKHAACCEQISGTQAKAVALEGQVEKLHSELIHTQKMITTLEDRITEVEGVVEKPSKNKKIFAFLTAVAGGIAWVAVNALSSSD